MTVLINLTSRDPDVFRQLPPNHHGKPAELLRVEGKIEDLWNRYLRQCDIVPLPNMELDNLLDEIDRLEKVRGILWNEWQYIKNVSAPIAVEADFETKNYLVNA